DTPPALRVATKRPPRPIFTTPARNTSPGWTTTSALTLVMPAASAAVTPGHSAPPLRTAMRPVTVPVPPSVPPLLIVTPELLVPTIDNLPPATVEPPASQ